MTDEIKKEETKEETKEEKPAGQSPLGGAKVEEAKVEENPSEKKLAEASPAKAEKAEPNPSGKKPAEASGEYADLIKKIEALSVKDLAALVKELEDRFGVSAAVAAPAASGAAGNAAGAPAADEKAEYTVMLTDAGAQKIAVIKAVREIRPDLGLKEAKDLVDGAPKEVKPNVPKDEAQVAKTKLEAAGAKVELK